MQKKIFNSLWILSVSLTVFAVGVIMWAIYAHFTREQLSELRNETRLAVRGVILNGQDYLNGLENEDFRITWITGEGKILYDNWSDAEYMEDPLERDEIIQAVKDGYGESSRSSPNFTEQYLYTAQRLPDDTILRLSIAHSTVLTLYLRFAFPLIGVILTALALSFLVSLRLSKRIVEPINNIDLDNPVSQEDEPVYAEITPLLRRIDEQHRQIKKDSEEIQRMSLIRQEFTANASHELKTPLHYIAGCAELMENGMVKDDDMAIFAGRIRSESLRMKKLVDDIIDLTEFDTGKKALQMQTVDLYLIAGNAVESLESNASEAGITVTLSGESTLICGISELIHSIVYNLCLNAINYSGSGKQVLVDVSRNEKKAVLRVQDFGIGIPKEDLDRIFERFYMVDKSRSKKVGGTGLGLSIVKHAVLAHGAEIHVESELGKGSVFSVVFDALS